MDTTKEAFSNLLYGNKIDETKNQTLSQKLIDKNIGCFKKTLPLNLILTPDSFRVKFLNNLIPIFKKKLIDDQDFVLNQDSALKNLQIKPNLNQDFGKVFTFDRGQNYLILENYLNQLVEFSCNINDYSTDHQEKIEKIFRNKVGHINIFNSDFMRMIDWEDCQSTNIIDLAGENQYCDAVIPGQLAKIPIFRDENNKNFIRMLNSCYNISNSNEPGLCSDSTFNYYNYFSNLGIQNHYQISIELEKNFKEAFIKKNVKKVWAKYGQAPLPFVKCFVIDKEFFRLLFDYCDEGLNYNFCLSENLVADK